jgi:hypothetical protein
LYDRSTELHVDPTRGDLVGRHAVDLFPQRFVGRLPHLLDRGPHFGLGLVGLHLLRLGLVAFGRLLCINLVCLDRFLRLFLVRLDRLLHLAPPPFDLGYLDPLHLDLLCF